MFGIGITEFIVIALVVIIFINPKDLPGFFRKLGKLYQTIKNWNKYLTDQLTKLDKDTKEKKEK